MKGGLFLGGGGGMESNRKHNLLPVPRTNKSVDLVRTPYLHLLMECEARNFFFFSKKSLGRMDESCVYWTLLFF